MVLLLIGAWLGTGLLASELGSRWFVREFGPEAKLHLEERIAHTLLGPVSFMALAAFIWNER